MNINQFVTSLSADEKKALCKRVGTSVPVLLALSSGFRMAGVKRAKRIVTASKRMFPNKPERQITLHGVRPDIW